MDYIIKSTDMSFSISRIGAQLISAKGSDGYEYMWKRDPRVWRNCAPVLFPICGQIRNAKYLYKDRTYEMRAHGFFYSSEPSVLEHGKDHISFLLTESESTLSQYPFSFSIKITFTAKGNALAVNTTVKNTGDEVMPFMYGAHPGFALPMSEDTVLSDYYVDFGCESIDLYQLIPDLPFVYKDPVNYPLSAGKLELTKTKLDEARTFLFGKTLGFAKLTSSKTSRAVTVTYPDFSYLGIWQDVKENSDFLCLEPWSGLPYGDDPENFETRESMERLAPKAEKSFEYTVYFE